MLTNKTLCVGFPMNGAEVDLKLGATDGVNVRNDNEEVSLYL